MIDFDRGSFHLHGQAVALIATFYKASYSRLLASSGKDFDPWTPKRWSRSSSSRFWTRLTRSVRTIPKPWDHSWRSGQRPVTRHAPLIHLCVDTVRAGRAGREDATDPRRGPNGRRR